MKAFALERAKEKDAFDIADCVQHFPDGVLSLAIEFKSMRGEQSVEEAISILKEKFSSDRHIGPMWAARYCARMGLDEAQERNRAFLNLKNLLELI